MPPAMTPARARHPTFSPALALYLALARWAKPVARAALALRARCGKEDTERRNERLGRPSAPRPKGALVWVHAASVGEALSLLPVVEGLRAARPDVALLITTGTVTSAMLMAQRLPAGVIHQYAPVDLVGGMREFLRWWRPGLCIWVESELWPAAIIEAHASGAALALINARMSARSAGRWRLAPRMIGTLLSRFSLILTPDTQIARVLSDLGAPSDIMRTVGNLKAAAAPLPVDTAALEAVRRRLDGRPCWVAASTHPGEEELIAKAHAALAKTMPDLITLIVPRHPERGRQIAVALAAEGLSIGLRSEGDEPDADCEIYIADTMGELGLWYRAARIVLVGGGFASVGGHNPLEPARLGAAILSGPDVRNFTAEYARLTEAGAARIVDTVEALTAAAAELIGRSALPTAAARAMGDAALAATINGTEVLTRTLDALVPLIPPREEG